MTKPLKVKALSGSDVEVVSALLQDMAIRVNDLKFIKDEHRFAMIGNRFCWEEKKGWFKKPKGERVRTALHFDGILSVSTQNINRSDSDAIVSLLSITLEKMAENHCITLNFAGDMHGASAIKLTAECIEILVSDVSDPWEAIDRPDHNI